ncbi:hypothetical protein MMC14_003898 [Varicellaria rhodocarpa]|nr:hypothetical protein [Varicellaria rhodocarpa]
MPEPSSTISLTFYPAYCFPASPTFNTWSKLTAANVHALTHRKGFEGQKTYFFLNHPIKWVRLVGVIVAFDEYAERWIFTLDDSSGATIQVVCSRDPTPITSSKMALEKNPPKISTGKTATGNTIDMSGIDLGTVVKVKGGIGFYAQQKQITLERISIIPSTTSEAQAWTELADFQTSVLSEPWLVLPADEAKLRAEADGTNRRLRRRKEKEKEKGKIKEQEARRRQRGKRRRREEEKGIEKG